MVGGLCGVREDVIPFGYVMLSVARASWNQPRRDAAAR